MSAVATMATVVAMIALAVSGFAVTNMNPARHTEAGTFNCLVPAGIVFQVCSVSFKQSFGFRPPQPFFVDTHPITVYVADMFRLPFPVEWNKSLVPSCYMFELGSYDCLGGANFPSYYLPEALAGGYSYGIAVQMATSGSYAPTGTLGWLQWANGTVSGTCSASVCCNSVGLNPGACCPDTDIGCPLWYDLTPKIPLDGSKGFDYGKGVDLALLNNGGTGRPCVSDGGFGTYIQCMVNSTLLGSAYSPDPSWMNGGRCIHPLGLQNCPLSRLENAVVRFVLYDPLAGAARLDIQSVYLIKYRTFTAVTGLETLTASGFSFYVQMEGGTYPQDLQDANVDWQGADLGCTPPGTPPNGCSGSF